LFVRRLCCSSAPACRPRTFRSVPNS
jgi:hypothetical protein